MVGVAYVVAGYDALMADFTKLSHRSHLLLGVHIKTGLFYQFFSPIASVFCEKILVLRKT